MARDIFLNFSVLPLNMAEACNNPAICSLTEENGKSIIADIKEPFKKILEIKQHIQKHYAPLAQYLFVRKSDENFNIEYCAYIDTSCFGVVNNYRAVAGLRQALSNYFDDFSVTIVADQLSKFSHGVQASANDFKILKSRFIIFSDYKEAQKLEDMIKSGRDTGDDNYNDSSGEEFNKLKYQRWLDEHRKKWDSGLNPFYGGIY